MPRPTFYNEQMAERSAAELLARLSRQSDRPITLPVPVGRILEDVCQLDVCWRPICEAPNQTILAGLDPRERLVILNETRRRLFDETPFLYSTTLAHEVGHWRLHVDEAALEHPVLPRFQRPPQIVCQLGSNHWQERHASWFASHLLVPRDMLAADLEGVETCHWRDLYRLGERYQVTITMMRIAVERLGRGYVDEEGHIHRSKRECQGQLRLL